MNIQAHPLTPEAGNPGEDPVAFVVDLTGQQAAVWRLEAGRAQIFAIPLRDGAPASNRRFLFTVEAPGLIFGLPYDGRLRIEAAVEPDSRLARLDWAELAEEQGGAACVDAWLGGWFAACNRYLPNRPERDLALSAALGIDAGRVLDGTHEVAWCRATAGCGALFDLAPVGVGGLGCFPLASGAWVRTFEPLTLLLESTPQLLAHGELAESLDGFHGAAVEVVTAALGLARVDEALRRERRAARIRSDTRRVVADLGRMVGAKAPYGVDPAANQALFGALRLVATRLGVRAQGPAAVRQADAESEPSLQELLRASGLRSRPVRLTQGWWRGGVDDMVAFEGAEHRPVALLRARRGYRIHDPVTGGSRPVDERSAGVLSPDAFVLHEPLPERALKLRDLLMFGLRDGKADLAVLAVAALIGATLGSVPAMVSKTIFETLIPQQQTGLLLQAGAALAALALISAVFVFSGGIAMARLRARASTRLKAALWDRVLRQPMSFLTRYSAPDLTLRIAAAENIVGAFHQMGQQSATTLGFLIANVATMVWLSLPAAAVAIGLLALLAGGTFIAAVAQKRAFTQGEQAEGSVSTFVHALTNGVRKLRLAAAEERAFVKWGDRFTRSRLKLINVRKVGVGYSVFLAAFNLAALAAIFAVVAQLKTSPVSAGAFIGFVTAFGVALASLASLGRVALQLAFQLASVPYVQPLLDAVPPPDRKKSPPGRLSGAVEVSNVAFRYTLDGPLVLGGVSFESAPGEFVAIVGPSGCGKSTLVKLLLGLEPPAAGAVLYDQSDLASLDVDALRQQVGVVLQRTQLMGASIFDNLRGASDIGLEEAWEAARLAGVDEDIRALPMGMHTLIAEGSQTISGGQRQRLALARALVRKPAVLILDEATSALDNVTQGEVMQNLAGLACTRIVIAHRLSTIIDADRIVVLDQGQVAETGTYAELMAAGGLFSRMAARQSAAA
ncbi:NHLP bacteriocin export ABC transporter permease/ATPase subunit [Phenylobacterium soli]|uniref:NHLP bacteriocin export ABC transporter permease/ATPase subunit n=1 Tax=Phenylobacterium soli TaxID=2170551 RepID=A0A328AF61_9CAUL|nr:NHLP bacteriocin export ABC transporter permease/ATPase subunit [Phenylobacterium soli]RAK53289.1 NHLP bacteriocin export ABC transporter permease/ATPase subunit [Phenylobacterium soli]